MDQKTFRFIFILALIAGLLLSFRMILLPKELPLNIIVVFPENLSTNIPVKTEIKFNFNRPLKSKNELTILLIPQTPFTTSQENNSQTLVIKPEGPLHSSTEYELQVLNQKNQLVWQSKFTTQKLQGDPRVVYESEQYTKENYPLLEFTPYDSNNFSLFYSRPLTLKVTIKKGNKETVEAEVIAWIKSHGVDPTTHQLEWLNQGTEGQ